MSSLTLIHTYKRKKGRRCCTVGVFGLTADSVADLLGHVSNLVKWIRKEVVCLQEVKGAEREQLKRDAHVAVVVKPVEHLHTVADGKQGGET